MENEMRKLSVEEHEKLLDTLKVRFEKNMHRHKSIEWENVKEKLNSNPKKLWSLNQMDITDGEPDVVGYDEITNEYVFYDCSKETPKGRRSVCYDNEALESRKQHKPQNSAIGMANYMGIEILSEAEYRYLQTLGEFDTKTSSWLKTPAEIRKLGGAIFGDFRYNNVFVYHNGADSYYGVRGFRGSLRI